ncbi:MAG: hypothetical protein J0G97_14450, partial [Rhizobium pusense]|nr:hypothetical protein [Agrobacterium pusense]
QGQENADHSDEYGAERKRYPAHEPDSQRRTDAYADLLDEHGFLPDRIVVDMIKGTFCQRNQEHPDHSAGECMDVECTRKSQTAEANCGFVGLSAARIPYAKAAVILSSLRQVGD